MNKDIYGVMQHYFKEIYCITKNKKKKKLQITSLIKGGFMKC